MRSPEIVLTPSCEVTSEMCRSLIDLAVQAGLESPMEDDSRHEGGVVMLLYLTVWGIVGPVRFQYEPPV